MYDEFAPEAERDPFFMTDEPEEETETGEEEESDDIDADLPEGEEEL